MNYLKEIVAFNDRICIDRMPTGQIALWHALMAVNNKTGWKEWFTVPCSVLELWTGLSRRSVYDARIALKKKGLIDYRSRGCAAAAYRMIPAAEQRPEA